MHRRILGFAAAIALSTVGPWLGASTAWAADVQKPTLTVPSRASFVVGQSMADAADVEGSLTFVDPATIMEYRWSASDASGICRYSIDEHHGAEGWYLGTQDYRTNSTTGRFSFNVDGWENSDDLDIIRVNAYDCAGNKTSVERPGSWVGVEEDLGPSVPSGWTRTTCTCFIGDTTLRTSTYGAALSSVVNANGYTKHVALVMAKGPARGKASLYYDGKWVMTLDTYAATNTNRVVMWDKEVTGSANHTIKVVNQATSGRPRIDVDAVVGG